MPGLRAGRRRWHLAPALAAALAVVVLGGAFVVAQQGPVTIGSVISMTGGLAEFGEPILNGAKLAEMHVNEQGGILGGRRLFVVNRDDQTNPVVGVDAAQRLVTLDRVPAFVGALSSGVTLPVATAVAVPNQVVAISPASTSPLVSTLDDGDFLFRTVASDALQGVVLGDLARELGFRRVAVLYVDNPYGLGLAEQFATTFSQNGGTVTASLPFQEGQASYRGELGRAARGNPEALLLISYPGSGIPILQQSLEGGYFRRFLFPDGMQAPEIIDAIGAGVLEGSFGTAPLPPPDYPPTEWFNREYSQRFGEPPPKPFITNTYDAVFLIALAIEKAGAATGPAIRDALREVANPPGEVVSVGEWEKAVRLIRAGRDIQYVGASGPVDFDDVGDVSSATIGIWEVSGGDIVLRRTVEVSK